MKTCTDLYKELLINHPSQKRDRQYFNWPDISQDEVINFKLDAIMYTLDTLVKEHNS